MRNAVRLILLSLFVLSIAGTADAQYFGRNKVQWENFDFKTLRTEHFDIYYYEQEADVVEDVGRMAERWYERLSRVFNHSFKRKPIVLYANPADFHQTTTTGGPLGEGTGGFTDAFMNRVVLPLTGDYAQNDHVLGHEIVHVFQYDIAASAAQSRRRFQLEMLPLWLVEGMAEYLSKGRVDPLTAMWVRDAAIHDRLPNLRELTTDPRYFPYRYGQALMAYIGGRFGDEAVVRYFMAAGMVGIEQAFDRSIGISAEQLFRDWRESARELYNPIVQARARTIGSPLIGKLPEVPQPRAEGERRKRRRRGQTELNVGPALSPDGRYLAFLSARELFSIDLFLADARTGKVLRRLVSSERDQHFESLRFIESAGAWSPDNRRLAFVTFARGDNFLSLVDVETRQTEHIRVPGVEAIINVGWAPDGRSVVIGGQATGVSDLFLYNLDTKQVRRLMSDRYADLQPVFSPDGRTIAFMTDRSSETNFETLNFGEKRIATIDIDTGRITVLPLFARGKQMNPQWAADGRSIFFIADPEGIPDVYRYYLDGGRIERITAVQTGVSGITDLAPALSVAGRTNDIVMTVFEDDNYNLYRVTPPAEPLLASSQTDLASPRAAILPPLRATGSEIMTYLEQPSQGLPPGTTGFEQRPYDASLRLAYLGPPTIGVGADQFGFGVGGSVSAYFSDVLGQHNVGFTFQGGGSSATSNILDQLGGEVFYLNQQSRLNWGADVVHVPYTSVRNAYGSGVIDVDGRPVLADIYEQLRLVQTISDVSGIAQYPLSQTRRIEAQAGFQRYAEKAELETLYAVGGSIIDRDIERLDGGFSINMWKAATAFVGDSSTFGFISPVSGTRYRYEIESLTGDLNLQTATADWRRYFLFRPVTVAVRGLHYGRYGDDAEDERLGVLYLGQGSLMRGYDPYSFGAEECANLTVGTCPTLDRLVGSKIGAGSLEVRAPLFGPEGFGLINSGFLPTEIFGFGDVGVAWTENESPTWEWETRTDARVPVFSVGVGLRILLSYIPIEIFAAKPFQRPDEEIVYGFNIVPGW